MASNKIKILHLIPSTMIGGAEQLLLLLAHTIDRQRFDLIIGMFVDGHMRENLFWNEAQKLGLSLEAIRVKHAFDLKQLFDVYKLLRKYHPDIIHTHGYKTNILGFIFAGLFRIPILTTVHGWFEPTNTKNKVILRVSLKFLRHFDRIIAVSHQIENALKEMNVAPRKILTIRNIPPILARKYSDKTGSFRDEVGIPSNSKIIGFVGRLERVKGCLQFIRAAAEVTRSKPDVFFVVVGEGSQREGLEVKVKQLGLEKTVYFCGFRSDIVRVFSSLDLYVLPSLNEGVPLTVLEAMWHGIPVVATSVGGVPEVIQNGVNGVLVPPNDPNALANGILGSLTNKKQTARRVKEAKKTIAAEYNIEKWIETIEDIYLQMMINH